MDLVSKCTVILFNHQDTILLFFPFNSENHDNSGFFKPIHF